MLEPYMKIKGAFRMRHYREVLNPDISVKDGNKINALSKATVTISTGKTFYVDADSRIDILSW